MAFNFATFFQTTLLPLITATAEAELPIILHSSTQGLAILNATEPIVNATVNAVAQAALQPAKPTVPVVSTT